MLRITHCTRYRYALPAAESHNVVRLMPLSDEDQQCIWFQLRVVPTTRIRDYEGPGGREHYFLVREPHTLLEITAESLVRTCRENPFMDLNLVLDDWSFYRTEAVRQGYAEFLAPTRLVPIIPEVHAIAAAARVDAGPSAASFARSLTSYLFEWLTYEQGVTSSRTGLEEFMRERRGVCQDYAHLMLAVCRSRGIPARYVSGYVYSGAGEDSLVGEQTSHAWVECLLPGEVWRGFDPTNALLADDHYVKAHVGRDYDDIVPLRGTYRGASNHSIEVEVRVEAESAPVLT